jgi:hypothetical protein
MRVIQAFDKIADRADKRDDVVFQIGHVLKALKIGNSCFRARIQSKSGTESIRSKSLKKAILGAQLDEFRSTVLFDRHDRAGCFKDDKLSGGTEYQFSNL